MTDKLNQDLVFEKNLMPKLHEEYNQNKTLNPFDMETQQIRKYGEERMVEKVDGGKYQLNEKGLGWE